MEEFYKIIDYVAYLYDCLNELRSIKESGSCENCKYSHKEMCLWLPKLGEMPRYNCLFYAADVDE